MRFPFVTLAYYILIQWIFSTKILAYRSPGETYPNTIEIEIGGSTNITCIMNLQKFPGKNSSSLYFEGSGKNVSADDIEIVNESSIIYMLRNAPAQNSVYLCKCEDKAIGFSNVYVGTPPADIKDFQCRGYDFTYMVCNFTIPKNNIMTTYSLNYTAQSPNYVQNCVLDVQESHGICNLTLDKNNYRANYEFYNFSLMGENALGTNKQIFWINHDENIIPPRPDLHIGQLTDSSINLAWNWIRYSYYKGLQYEVKIRPYDFDWMNYTNYEISNHKSEYKLKLFGLPYAFYTYTVRFRIKVKVKSARYDDTMWSEPSLYTFQTKPRLPESSPITDVGSFYIDPTETQLRIYWKQLPVYHQNGPNFKYVIKSVERDGIEMNMLPLHIDNTSATFPWERNHKYKYTIKSRNDVGESVESETITVHPISNQRFKSPGWIRNVYHTPNRTYTLSWSPPIDEVDLIDYTVFWCQSKRALLNECEGTIQFEHISKGTTNYITAPQILDHTLNLAISANYIDYNSGMHWTMCPADSSSDLVKLEPEIMALSSRTIQIQWSPDSICTSLLEGYNLTYCIVESAHNLLPDVAECVNESKTVTIDKTKKKYLLTDLKPFTSYKLQIYMFSKSKRGNTSDPIVIPTNEEAPTPPRNLNFGNVTSNSAWITWMPPLRINGDLRYYTIIQNNEHHILNCTLEAKSNCTNDTTKDLDFELKNLSSFTDYKVYVIANTVEASFPSNDIHFKTLIAIPSNPRHTVLHHNSNRNVLQWDPPEVPSGRVEFYEVAVIVWYKDEVLKERISGVVGTTSCTINAPVCIDTDYKHTLQVRAVNVALLNSEVDYQVFSFNNTANDSDAIYYEGNDDLKCIGTSLTDEEQTAKVQRYRNKERYKQYKSEWEKGPIYGCAATDQTKQGKLTSIALLAVIMSLGVMAAFYFARNKYNKMANIDCALPPGLDSMPYPAKGGGVDNINIDKDDEEFNRSKESLEKHHLLSSVCNDSGYLGGGVVGGINNAGPCSIGKSSGYIGSDHSDMGYTQQHNLKLEEPPTDAYMIMEVLKANTDGVGKKSQPMAVPINDGYIKPGNEDSFIGLKREIPLIPSNNGYIKPNKILNWHPGATTAVGIMHNKAGSIPVSSSGYVQPQMLQKQMTQPLFDGYTSLDALGKPPLGSATIQTITSPETFGRVTSVPPPISGYVTQKELSAYGQHEMS